LLIHEHGRAFHLLLSSLISFFGILWLSLYYMKYITMKYCIIVL
jgi:hypothetical protein